MGAGPRLHSPEGVTSELKAASKAAANVPKQMTLMEVLGTAKAKETSALTRDGDEPHHIPRSEFQRFAQHLRDRMFITMYQIGSATGDTKMMRRIVHSLKQKKTHLC